MSILLSIPAPPSSRTPTTVLKLYNYSFSEANHPSLFHQLPGLAKKSIKKGSCITYSVNSGQSSTLKTISDSNNDKSSSKGFKEKPLLSEGRDDDEKYGLVCPGCGVFMQDNDPTLPGYYQQRNVDVVKMSEDEDFDGFLDDIDGELVDGDEEEGELVDSDEKEGQCYDKGKIDWELEDLEPEFDDDLEMELDGFTLAGVGYGNITEEFLEQTKKKKKVSKAEKKRLAREAPVEKDEVTVCARCHSLRYHGQVKNQTAENLIPDFDFDRLISTRLMKPTGNADSTVVVVVVDCVDFDGSFPRRAAKSLFKALDERKDGVQRSKKLPKIVLVATKVDLLPSQISPTRLDKWVRHRAKAHGAPRLNGVFLVSSRKDLGVRNLLTFVKELAGPRGHVWVIGAQNAGKSTLINMFAKKGGVKATKLTEAALPGTTLGILRVGGILSAKAKMYDTPGLLHPYLISLRLNRDEQKMVELRKELSPRTYRIQQGQTIHVGGLMRLDLNQSSVPTIYVTVWASPNVSLHLGKIENADEILNKHAGVRLQPPIGVDRLSELGRWKEKEIKVSGASWEVNSVDISVAGFGWFSLGLKGEATLSLWTFDGIDIIVRDPLVLDRSQYNLRPGFWLPKAISDAIANLNKAQSKAEKAMEEHELV